MGEKASNSVAGGQAVFTQAGGAEELFEDVCGGLCVNSFVYKTG